MLLLALPLPWQLPVWHGTGFETLGKFLTFASVSSGSWQLLGGPRHMCLRLDMLKWPIVLTVLCLSPSPSFVASYEESYWVYRGSGARQELSVGSVPNPVWYR